MADLNVRSVAADGATPAHWLAVLHGIYGAGRNWGSVGRSLVAARPEWGALLVDLRQHGESVGFEPPHTLERTAADLDSLSAPGGVRAVLGHSFGGKVALLRAGSDPALEQVWVIDSTPEVREPEGGAWEMLHVLRRVQGPFPDRDATVEALTERGVARPVALWMTTNLEPRSGEYHWRLDLDEMEALLRDFFRTDLWDRVESPPPGVEIHFVKARESSVLGLAQAERIRRAGTENGRVFLHEVAGGHWLNADNPEAVVELLAGHLPST